VNHPRIIQTNRPTRTRALLALASLCVAAGSLLSAPGCSKARSSAVVLPEARSIEDMGGRFIVALNDADMNADSFVTRDLGERDPRVHDSITIVSLPIQEPSTPFAQIKVSNSALGPPRCLDIDPAGDTLYVVESRGPAHESARTLDDLPPGEYLAVIDVRNPLEPEQVQNVYVGTEPTSVSASPRGDLLAIATRTPGEQLVLAALENGRVTSTPDGKPAVLAWPLYGVSESDDAAPSSIAWSPDGDTIAVTIPARNQVAFYRLTRDADGSISLAVWGSPVNVGKYPYLGSFSRDGQYFLVSCTGWGEDVPGFSVGAAPGSIDVVRLGTIARQTDQGLVTEREHEVVSSARVGIGPKAMALSPDGRTVVAANTAASPQAASAPSDDHDSAARSGSVSLLVFDPPSGMLTTISEQLLSAVPADVCFDSTGRIVGVTQFRSFDPRAVDGELGLWSIVRGPRGDAAGLKSLDRFIGLGKGPHATLIAP